MFAYNPADHIISFYVPSDITLVIIFTWSISYLLPPFVLGYSYGLSNTKRFKEKLTDYSSIIANFSHYGSRGKLSHPFSKSEQLLNSYAYTSRELAENTLYYHRARYYKSNISIFFSYDNNTLIRFLVYAPFDKYKKLEKLMTNTILQINKNNKTYIFTNNNPINYYDPNGESSIVIITTAVGSGSATAATAGVAIVICFFIPQCKDRLKCLPEFIINTAKCIWKGLCNWEEKQTEFCLKNPWETFLRCVKDPYQPYYLLRVK